MQKLKEKAYDDAYDAFRRSHRAHPTSARTVEAMVNTLIAQDRAEEPAEAFLGGGQERAAVLLVGSGR